jgi:hypothetical protein
MPEQTGEGGVLVRDCWEVISINQYIGYRESSISRIRGLAIEAACMVGECSKILEGVFMTCTNIQHKT